MSIAACVLLRPSRALAVLRAAYGWAVILSGLVYPDWALVCLLLVLRARATAPQVLRRIDISAGAAWRLTVYQITTLLPASSPAQQAGLAPAQASAACVPPACVTTRMAEPVPVHYLQAGTLLWPCLMCLHLRAQDGSQLRLLVLPDSVSDAEWRALMLASRALAARSEIKLRTL